MKDTEGFNIYPILEILLTSPEISQREQKDVINICLEYGADLTILRLIIHSDGCKKAEYAKIIDDISLDDLKVLLEECKPDMIDAAISSRKYAINLLTNSILENPEFGKNSRLVKNVIKKMDQNDPNYPDIMLDLLKRTPQHPDNTLIIDKIMPHANEAIILHFITTMPYLDDLLIDAIVKSPILSLNIIDALFKLHANDTRYNLNRLIAQHYESHEIIQYLAQQSIASPESLLQLFNANAAAFQSVNQLAIFIAETDDAIAGWQNNPAQSAQLLQAILAHPAADEVLKQTALRLVLIIFQANDAFWANIPASVTEINWMNVHLDDMNDQDLSAIFQAIAHIQQLDLRNNNLASKGPGLADILAVLPPALTRLDLRDNNIDHKMMKTLHRRIPPTVTEIAYDGRGFVPRLTIQQQFAFNYSFYLKCLAALAVVAGGALLVVGILLANPIFIIAGASAAGAGVSTLAGIGAHRLFSNQQKKQPKQDPVANDDAVDSNPDDGVTPP